MKHDVHDLLAIVHRYYPRGIRREDSRYEESEEHDRLVAARRKAAADERWQALRRRISEQCPGMFANQSHHLLTGDHDASYAFTISPPGVPDHRTLWFQVSFLAPYSLVHSRRLIEDIQQTEILRTKRPDIVKVAVHGLHFELPRSALSCDILLELDEERREMAPVQREDITFTLSPDEQSYAAWITRDIEATFGCESMPPEVGALVVPDVATNVRALGEATLYDCLFSDGHPGLPAEPPNRVAWISVDASRMPASFLAVATVLAALYRLAGALAGMDLADTYCVVSTDGALHKEQMLQLLAGLPPPAASPMAPRLVSAVRELEALVAEWEGEGAPPDAMIGWASDLLKSL